MNEKSASRGDYGRYGLVYLVKDWISVLMKKEETRGLTQPELIKRAVDDIMTGAVKEKEIKSELKKLSSFEEGRSDDKKDKK